MSSDNDTTRWTRWLAGGACVLAALAFLMACVLFGLQARASQANCDRIHKVVDTLGDITESGQKDVVQLGTEGTLSAEQVKRLLRKNAETAATLRLADCSTP